MTTLVDIRKAAKVCDDATIRKTYTLIALRLKEIMREISRHEQDFSKYQIKNNPVANATTTVIMEIDTLENLPAECLPIKRHTRELAMKLREFKSFIGTAFCNTPRQAYELFANHVVGLILERVRKDIKMPDITLQFSKIYTELITRTTQTK